MLRCQFTAPIFAQHHEFYLHLNLASIIIIIIIIINATSFRFRRCNAEILVLLLFDARDIVISLSTYTIENAKTNTSMHLVSDFSVFQLCTVCVCVCLFVNSVGAMEICLNFSSLNANELFAHKNKKSNENRKHIEQPHSTRAHKHSLHLVTLSLFFSFGFVFFAFFSAFACALSRTRRGKKIHFAAFNKLIYAKLFIFFVYFHFGAASDADISFFCFHTFLLGLLLQFLLLLLAARCSPLAALCVFCSIQLVTQSRREKEWKKAMESRRKVYSSAQYGGKLCTFVQIAHKRLYCVCILQYVPY